MDEMVIIGMDPHKASNTIAVLDSTENLLTRRRFEYSDDGFASYIGTAPVAASSGDHHRHRMNRAGNRQLNHALYIAAIN